MNKTNNPIPFPMVHQGKVRDVYEVSDSLLLMVASDRVSAFDVILPQTIPRKGEVLTKLTAWWLDSLRNDLDHHLISVDHQEILSRFPTLENSTDNWINRSMLVHKTKPVMVECVVRGYISGSAWKEYRNSGTLAGEKLPEGLIENGPLPSPIFSPSTKATTGHDENITFAEVINIQGEEEAQQLKNLSFHIYTHGANFAKERGIILADTKFEFGHHKDGRLLLIDEVLTPDSSRFWPAQTYKPGETQPSLDKQPVRDFLDAISGWNKQPPPPDLTDEVVNETTSRYLKIFRELTGTDLDSFSPPEFE